MSFLGAKTVSPEILEDDRPVVIMKFRLTESVRDWKARALGPLISNCASGQERGTRTTTNPVAGIRSDTLSDVGQMGQTPYLFETEGFNHAAFALEERSRELCLSSGGKYGAIGVRTPQVACRSRAIRIVREQTQPTRLARFDALFMKHSPCEHSR